MEDSIEARIWKQIRKNNYEFTKGTFVKLIWIGVLVLGVDICQTVTNCLYSLSNIVIAISATSCALAAGVIVVGIIGYRRTKRLLGEID